MAVVARQRWSRRGIILPTILLMLILIGLLAASLSFHINARLESTRTSIRGSQTRLAAESWIEKYVQGPGYKPEWGQPQTGGILKYGASHVLIGHDPNYGHSFEGPQFLPTYNALLRFDTWQGLGGPIAQPTPNRETGQGRA